jgi:hypothetical protein
MLAYVAGSIDEELLARNEYLVTENRILRGQIKGRVRLTDSERLSLVKVAIRLGRKALAEVAQDRSTGNHSCVAPAVDRPEIRRLEESISRSFGRSRCARGIGFEDGAGKPDLGVSADCRGTWKSQFSFEARGSCRFVRNSPAGANEPVGHALCREQCSSSRRSSKKSLSLFLIRPPQLPTDWELGRSAVD